MKRGNKREIEKGRERKMDMERESVCVCFRSEIERQRRIDGG